MKKTGTGKRTSLKKEAFVAIFICISVTLVITLLLSFRYYIYSVIKNYKTDLNNISSFTLSQIDSTYLADLFSKTRRTYDSMPDEIKKDPFSDEYKSYFIPLVDEKYIKARNVLSDCRENTNISNIYVGFYDEEKERLILVLDGDVIDYAYIPGQYIENQEGNLESWSEIQRIMASDWYMSFTHSELLGYAATDYSPLYDKGGSFLGVVAIDTYIYQFRDEVIGFISLFLPVIIVLFIILSVIISHIIQKRIITPVNDLAGAAKAYTARDKVNESMDTNFFKQVNVHSTNELTDLRDTMALMESDVHRSMDEIRRVSAEKEHMAAELEIASEIQKSALSKDFPKSEYFDLYASMNPAKEIGGDFYDFFMIDDDHLALVIADVSGKGVPAALFMMKGKELLKNRASMGGSPSQIMAHTNNALAKDNDGSMFITIWLGILEISTRIITATNAGHEYPFISDADRNFSILKDPHGVSCGVMEDLEYEDYTIALPPHAGIFVYTDGVAEANNKEEEFFNLERIEKSLNNHRTASSKELINLMKKDIDDFSSGVEQFDDITMLCLFMKQ